MAKDEVELGNSDEDYEVVPVGPIRKLERRIDEIEEQGKASGSGPSDDLIHDVLDIMKSNQKIVNDMTESTHELKNSVEDLTHKMDSVIDNMNSFMDLLEEASEADLEGEVMNDVHSRIADAVGNQMQEVANDIKESNQHVVENLEDLNKSIKRSYTAQNKDQTLSGDSNQGVMNRNRKGEGQQNNRSPQNRQQNQRGNSPDLNIDRDQNGGERGNSQRRGNQSSRRERNGNGQDSDRMRKLKERFDKIDDDQ